MFDWEEFLVFAEQLTERGTDEAALRSAISRAYYAVYHRASAYLRANALVLPGSRLSHRTVWGAFEAGSHPRRLQVWARGDVLRRLRTSADYHNPFPGDLQTLARDATLEARAVLDLLDQL